MKRINLIAAMAALGAALLAVGLLSGCTSAPPEAEAAAPTTLVLLDDDTVVESVEYAEAELEAMTLDELEDLASALRIDLAGKDKAELIDAILEAQTPSLNIRRGGDAVV